MYISDKQLGTLILALHNSFLNRERIKLVAIDLGIKHLNNLEDECKLLLSLHSELEKNKR